jgi:beta-glucosidase
MAPALPVMLLHFLMAVVATSEASSGTNCGEDVACFLREMSLDEKLQFFAGDLDAIDHITGVSRLGIPDINMGDGPNGVANTIAGTTTSFPCNLAVGNTFDHVLARAYGQAMAKEFKAKGKNQILGPGVNLARLPQVGRLDEYIPGEDPVLGAELVKEVVQGALDEHVMTCIKHFVNNDQETNRNHWSANPDTHVQMEYYMKPFFAAIQAGAASLMCGYNKVNGLHACKNSGILQAAKKVGNSFWIVGDWGAVYPEDDYEFAAEYVNAGLDMEMGAHDDPTCTGPDVPATKYGAGGYCNKGDYMLPDRMRAMLNSGAVTMARIDETVSRVLGALKTAGLLRASVQAEFPVYTHSDLHSKWFGPLMQRDVRTKHSRQVAHNVARSAIVLLQNTRDLLPLQTTDRIETYGCGDEVHFRVEQGSASGTTPHMPKVPCQAEDETACPYPEDGLRAAGASVQGFRLADGQSGPRDASAIAVICLMASAKNSEGTDRANLDLEGADTFPFERFSQSVVFVFSPGPVLMPFTSRVTSIVLMSLPGEMGGAAVADILLGQASPTGHLSLTMPNQMHETPVLANAMADDYAEDFEVAYRWYQAQSRHPCFAFGWGLSYAKYMQVVHAELLKPTTDQRPRVYLMLRRDQETGTRYDGTVDQVVQLYVQHEVGKLQGGSFE